MTGKQLAEIAIDDALLVRAKKAVAEGAFGSLDEVVNTALQMWTVQQEMAFEHIEALKEALREGRESGPPLDGKAALAALKAKFADQAG